MQRVMLAYNLVSFHKAWRDFFSSSDNYIEHKNNNSQLKITTSNSYYVSSCYFVELKSEGAIQIGGDKTNELKFLVDTSSFENCENEKGIGGSLWISSSKCECVQDRICSFASKSKTDGAFCYTLVSDSSPFRNYVLDSTIALSEGRFSNLYLTYGLIYLKSINISHSKMTAKNFYDSTFDTNSNATFSTFTNNTSTGDDYLAYHEGSSDKFDFKICYSRYYENDCKKFLYSRYNLNIINCSIYQNDIKSIYFEVSNKKKITIQKCYLDFTDPSTKGDGEVNIEETVKSIYPANSHLFTGLCFAEVINENPEKSQPLNIQDRISEPIRAHRSRFSTFRRR